MVQALGPGGASPTEQSPLLRKPGNQNGHNGTNISTIKAPSPESDVDRNRANGFGSEHISTDEENWNENRDEVDEGLGRGQVARIISVLLIGALKRFQRLLVKQLTQ